MQLVAGSIAPATVLLSLAGGALIGLAAALLLMVHGRIFGVSGILNGVLDQVPRRGPAGDLDWRIALLGGLIGGAALASWLAGAPPPRTGFPGWALAVAGLLVGFGTRLGSGCTSGHGICGIARFSPRSLAATVVFIATGVATVLVLRHALGVFA